MYSSPLRNENVHDVLVGIIFIVMVLVPAIVAAMPKGNDVEDDA